MQQVHCYVCRKDILTDEKIVEFCRPGTKKTYYCPQTCWRNGSRFCQAKEVRPEPVQLCFYFEE